MCRMAYAALAGLVFVLASAQPAQAWGRHHRVYMTTGYGAAQPVVPVSPFSFQQVALGLQMAQGLVNLAGELRQPGPQGGPPGRQTPPPHPQVTPDVVKTLDRVDDAQKDLVDKVNKLIDSVRDPQITKDFAKFKDHVEISKPAGQGSGPGTLTPPP